MILTHIIEGFTSSPLNVLLLVILLYLLSVYLRRPSPIVPDPEPEPEPIVLKNFTRSELAKFNGVNGAKIYIAIKGKVFDVTRSSRFYGPEGAYGVFAGKDATRGLALNDTDESVLVGSTSETDSLSDLKPEEIESLEHWLGFFETKNGVAGWIGSLFSFTHLMDLNECQTIPSISFKK